MSRSDVWLPFAPVTRELSDRFDMCACEKRWPQQDSPHTLEDPQILSLTKIHVKRRGPAGATQRSHGFNNQLMRVAQGGGTEGRGGLLAEVLRRSRRHLADVHQSFLWRP